MSRSKKLARIEPAAPTEALTELSPRDPGRFNLTALGMRFLPGISGCGHAGLGHSFLREVTPIVTDKADRSDPKEAARIMEEAVVFLAHPEGAAAAALAAQLCALHTGFMRALNAVENATDEGRREAHLARATKLHRCYIAAFEALEHHRRGGSQRTMRVEHVHVYPGGQAIVGPVQAGGPPPLPKNQK